MKYTKTPLNAYERLQLNSGILLSAFNPSTGIYSRTNIVGATKGGVEFSITPEYRDIGEDIDSCPNGMSELARIDGWAVLIKGRFTDLIAERTGWLLTDTDFADLWWVGDYSDKNSEGSGGFMAIHMKNALSTGGFGLLTEEDELGEGEFEYRAYSTAALPDSVPCELYVKAGTESGSAGGTTYTQIGSITASGNTTEAIWYNVNLAAGVYGYKLDVSGSSSSTATAIVVKQASSGADAAGTTIVSKTCAECNGGASFTGTFTVTEPMPYLYMKYTPFTASAQTASFSIAIE